jgi:hypothetical protein
MIDWNSAPKIAGEIDPPVERAAVEERVAHSGVERGNRQRLLEQAPVDVGEGAQLLVQRRRSRGVGLVQDLKQLRQLRAEIGPILRGALVQPHPERLRRLEDPGVVGDKAEQHADQQQLQRMIGVAACSAARPSRTRRCARVSACARRA